MAACGSDFLVADDFDAVMGIIGADMLENDTVMSSKVNFVVENLLSAKKSRKHHCHMWCIARFGTICTI